MTTTTTQTTYERVQGAFAALKDSLGYTNAMQAPKVVKVIISTGVGKVSDKHQRELIVDRLAKITGQKPASRGAKQSIASFKLRQGDIVGYQVTLRGARMRHFLDKLINIALPRTRDFRGVKASAIDEMGNYTLGIKEHTIFPETSDEELRNVFGLSITIVTTARTKDEARVFLEHLGVPFAKDETA